MNTRDYWRILLQQAIKSAKSANVEPPDLIKKFTDLVEEHFDDVEFDVEVTIEPIDKVDPDNVRDMAIDKGNDL